MMRYYVLGFLFHKNKILMLQRTKEDWQYGTVNGIGGKVELGEHRKDAMIREFKEETNDSLISPDWQFILSLIFPDTNITVYVFRGFSNEDFSHLDNVVNPEGILKVFNISDLITNKNIKKAEDVDWLVSLCNSPFSNLLGSISLWHGTKV